MIPYQNHPINRRSKSAIAPTLVSMFHSIEASRLYVLAMAIECDDLIKAASRRVSDLALFYFAPIPCCWQEGVD